MDLYIYEDQTGNVIYPFANNIDENIKKYFNIGTDIFIEKRRDKLTIYCHIIARKGSDRYQGYYIKYLNDYTDHTFTELDRNLNKVLVDLGLILSPSDIINTVFNNIKRFDSGGNCRHIDIIKDLISSGNRLEYNGGYIDKISIFCKNILENIDSVTVSISSEDSKLGNINIIRKTYNEQLRRSDSTKQIFETYKTIEDRKKRDNEEKEANKVIIEGVTLIRRGVNSIENIGRDPKEIIRREMGGIIDRYSIKNVSKEIDEKEEKKTNVFYIYIMIFVVTLIIGILIGMYINSKISTENITIENITTFIR